MSSRFPDAPDFVPRRFRAWHGLLLISALIWLATSFYVVRGNEAAVLRICGRVDRTADGAAVVRPSGLHYHLPWPFTTVDRVNINEVRTAVIGSSEMDQLDSADFLTVVDSARHSRFLSGDKNILHVQLNVHYRVSLERIDDWLYRSRAVEPRLLALAGAVTSDVVLRCGVDFVHTLGHDDIRRAVLLRLRKLVLEERLGVDIEDVTIISVTPPVRVKAEFVDVMNARADRETSINRARAYAEQQEADARAVERRLTDEAEAFRRRTVDLARAEAESFDRMIDEMQKSASTSATTYAQVRSLTLRRLHLEAIEDVYQRLKGKIVLGSENRTDITLQPQ